MHETRNDKYYNQLLKYSKISLSNGLLNKNYSHMDHATFFLQHTPKEKQNKRM